MQTSGIEIVTLPVTEWQAYRRLRLEMLRDSPSAFGSTYQDQQSLPDSFWQGRLEQAAQGEHSWLFFARSGSDLLGMIGAFREDADSLEPSRRLATIISVYVTPAARGRGISNLLMDAILAKLVQCGFQRAQLGVTADQTAAVHLYQRFGFSIIKTETERMGDGLEHTGLLMEKTLY
jgi:ribosomal protein S18 acetylase RimI-like enzyme